MTPSLIAKHRVKLADIVTNPAFGTFHRVDGLGLFLFTLDGPRWTLSDTHHATVALFRVNAVSGQPFADAGRAPAFADVRLIFVAEIGQSGQDGIGRSEERRVGKECRSRW